jgi:hypothetical protein
MIAVAKIAQYDSNAIRADELDGGHTCRAGRPGFSIGAGGFLAGHLLWDFCGASFAGFITPKNPARMHR